MTKIKILTAALFAASGLLVMCYAETFRYPVFCAVGIAGLLTALYLTRWISEKEAKKRYARHSV